MNVYTHDFEAEFLPVRPCIEMHYLVPNNLCNDETWFDTHGFDI